MEGHKFRRNQAGTHVDKDKPSSELSNPEIIQHLSSFK